RKWWPKSRNRFSSQSPIWQRWKPRSAPSTGFPCDAPWKRFLLLRVGNRKSPEGPMSYYEWLGSNCPNDKPSPAAWRQFAPRSNNGVPLGADGRKRLGLRRTPGDHLTPATQP